MRLTKFRKETIDKLEKTLKSMRVLLWSSHESPTEGPQCGVCLNHFDSEGHKATRLDLIIEHFHWK